MRTFYLANSLIKDVILHNPYTKIRLLSAGLKVFSRHDLGPQESSTTVATEPETSKGTLHFVRLSVPSHRKSAFRFVNDGILTMQDFVVSEAKLLISLSDLKKMVAEYFPLIQDFEEPLPSVVGSKSKYLYCGQRLFINSASSARKLYWAGQVYYK